MIILILVWFFFPIFFPLIVLSIHLFFFPPRFWSVLLFFFLSSDFSSPSSHFPNLFTRTHIYYDLRFDPVFEIAMFLIFFLNFIYLSPLLTPPFILSFLYPHNFYFILFFTIHSISFQLHNFCCSFNEKKMKATAFFLLIPSRNNKKKTDFMAWMLLKSKLWKKASLFCRHAKSYSPRISTFATIITTTVCFCISSCNDSYKAFQCRVTRGGKIRSNSGWSKLYNIVSKRFSFLYFFSVLS